MDVVKGIGKGSKSEKEGGLCVSSGHQDWPCCYKNTFFHQPPYAKGKDQVLNHTSHLLFYFSSSPLLVPLTTQAFCLPSLYPCTILLLLFPLFVSFIFPSASLLPALQLIWESDPWALMGQVIQGHWQVISADWLTSKRTSGRSQSDLAPYPPKADPSPQLISSLCHMTRVRRQREDD